MNTGCTLLVRARIYEGLAAKCSILDYLIWFHGLPDPQQASKTLNGHKSL